MPEDDAVPDNDAVPETDARTGVTAAAVLFALSAVWLAATMFVAHASIVGTATDAVAVAVSSTYSLPGVIAASLLAGAGGGLFACRRFAATAAAVRRLAVGGGTGAAIGVLIGAAVLFGYGATSSIVVLAITVATAALLGGTSAALPLPVLSAGVAATLGVFLAGATLNLFQSELTQLLGAGGPIATRLTAATRFSYLHAAIGGVVSGTIAYGYLRRLGHSWPAYLAGGAFAGALIIVGEALFQIGGSSLLDTIKGLSVIDRAFVEYLDAARLRNGLIVGFVGGILAMILLGRTLRTPEPASLSEPSIDQENS